MVNFDPTHATPTRTEEEILDIAQANPEVSSWIEVNNAKLEAINYSNGTWKVVYTSSNDEMVQSIIIKIDDKSGEITEILYEERYESPNQDYVDKALQFVRQDTMTHDFISSHPGMDLYGYQYQNEISIYGYHWTDSDDTGQYYWINIILDITSSEPSFKFNFISSNDLFGLPEHDFDEIKSYALGLDPVVQFQKAYPNASLTSSLTFTVDDRYEFVPVGYSYQLNWGNLLYYPMYDLTESQSTRTEPSVPTDESDSSDQFSTTQERIVLTDFCQEYYGWLLVGILDHSLDMYELAGTTTADKDRNEVLEIVESSPIFLIWLSDFSYSISATFDGYDTWWVNIYGLQSMYWGYARVSDTNGTILESYIFTPIEATKSGDQIRKIVLSNQEIEHWIDNVLDYEIYTYYNFQGDWWVYLWDPIVSQNYAYVQVDDITGSISEISSYSVPKPKLSLNDVFSILRGSELVDFLDSYPDAQMYLYYYEAKWYVYAYSPIVVEASIQLVIDDNNGNIIQKYMNYPENLPQMTEDEVITLIKNTEEYLNFTKNKNEYQMYIYYYQGFWSVSLYRTSNIYYSYTSFYAMIDDQSRSIIQINYYEGSSIGCFYGYTELDQAANDLLQRSPESPYQQSGKGYPLAGVLHGDMDDTTSQGFLTPYSSIIIGITFITIVIIRRSKDKRLV